MAWGVYANVAVTGAASAAYALAAGAAWGRQRRLGKAVGPAPWFFGLISAFLLLAALRQLAAATLGEAWDLRIYFANVPVAASAIIPHSYLVALVRTGSPTRARLVAGVFAAAVLVGVVFAFLGGVTEEPRTDYGTDWALDSAVAAVLIIVAILLPGLVGSGWLVVLSRRFEGSERRRISLIGWSALAYFAIFTLDAYGLSGPLLLTARVLTAGTGLLAWWAYQEPEVHTYTPPPDKPGENPFGR
jgi:uncharacterized membrane protein